MKFKVGDKCLTLYKQYGIPVGTSCVVTATDHNSDSVMTYRVKFEGIFSDTWWYTNNLKYDTPANNEQKLRKALGLSESSSPPSLTEPTDD